MVRALALLLLPLQLGCAAARIERLTAPSVEQGMLSVGDREYQLTTCNSGGLECFLAADLRDATGAALLRLLIDPPDGPRPRPVLREAGAEQRIILGPGQCRQLVADVRPTGWRVNTVRDSAGVLNAECVSDTGEAVAVRVRFSHCH